jgi:hypothetical protein
MTPLEQAAERLRPIVNEYGWLSTIDAMALAASSAADSAEGEHAERDAAYLNRIAGALCEAPKRIMEGAPHL